MQGKRGKSYKNNPFLSFLIVSLHGVSQVLLVENAVTGVFVLLAIATFSYTLAIIAFLSSVLGTIVAKLGGADDKIIQKGLFGFNSVLTGIALTLFLSPPYNWIIALIGASLVTVLTAALMHFIQGTKIPILTFPFISLTWFILLASHKFGMYQLDPSLTPQALSSWTFDLDEDVNWLYSFLKGVAQVFFLNNIYSGILLLIALFWAGWRFGLYTVIANGVAILTAFLLGGEYSLITQGLYSYNAILTIIAVSIVFKENDTRFSLVSGIIGACLTVPITASVSLWLLPYGIPALTMAFVLTAWVILAARKILPNL